VGGQAWIDLVGASSSPDGVGSRQDLPAQALIDFLARPGDRRSVLEGIMRSVAPELEWR
jgi:hypothetical protein